MSYASGFAARRRTDTETIRRRSPRRSGAALAAILALLACVAPACLPQARAGTRDAPLVTDVLAALERAGVRLLYSSQLVPPGLRARGPVTGSTVRERLRSLLAPLGLEARSLPGGGYAIVRAEPAPTPAVARSPVEEPLERIVVQTSRYRSSPIGGVTTGRHALENSPETHNDAVRALQVIPGTAVAGYTARTHVRGSRDDEILFRYDGVTLNQPYHLKELQSLFSPVDPAAVNSVTSWTGIAPIEFGDQIGGVVDIAPRRIHRTTVDLQASEQGASAMAGTVFGSGRGTVFADLRMQNEFAPVGWIETRVGAPTLNDMIVHATWRFDSRTTLAAGTLAIDDRRKYFSTENAQNKAVNGGEFYAWLRLEHRFGERLQNVTLLSSEDSHENVNGSVAEPYLVTGQLQEHSWHAVYTLRDELRDAPSTRWAWHAGAEATVANLVDDSSGYAAFSAPFAPDLQPHAIAISDESVAAHAMTWAAYGSVRWRATRRLVADLGVRRDQRKFSGLRADAQWGVRANLRERLSAVSTMRLGWGQESQADVFDPRVVAGSIVPQTVRRVTQTDLSFERLLPHGWTVRAEGYYKDEGTPYSKSTYVFSPFALLPELAVDRVHVLSARSRMTGIELSLTTDRARPLSGSVSYVWSRAMDLVAGRWVPRAWDQPNAVKVDAAWRHEAFRVAASAVWHTGWPYTPLLASRTTWTDPNGVSLGFAPLNSARLGSFLSLDARIAWEHRLGHGVLQAFLDVYDLTDSHVTCCRSYAVVRSASGTYGLVESRSPWLNLTPIFGVRWHY
ncbi:MAG: TonB-dependent receptor [Gammaproteobacteria bacterium]|nr:TonB-dependent receptor [Gammaproteobacteria bacterium]